MSSIVATGNRPLPPPRPAVAVRAEPPSKTKSSFYDELIRPLEDRMMRSIWRVVRDAGAAEDVLQEALVVIWKKRDRIRRHPNPQALILKICLNKACDALRKSGRDRRRMDEAARRFPTRIEPATGESLEYRIITDEVTAAVRRLPRNQSLAVMMRILQDQAYSDIALALGCKEVTARIHVARGRAKLSRWMAHLKIGSDLEIQDE